MMNLQTFRLVARHRTLLPRTSYRNEISRGSRSCVLLASILGAVFFFGAQAPAYAVDSAEKCGAQKLIALGNFAQCRLKQTAKAVKSGQPADFSKCDRALDRRFLKAQQSDDCSVSWDAEQALSSVSSCVQESVHAAGADTLQAPGWWCPGPPPAGCKPICGDGIQAGNETCDDGNTASGDGCSAGCRFEGLPDALLFPYAPLEIVFSPDRDRTAFYVPGHPYCGTISSAPEPLRLSSEGCAPGSDRRQCRYWTCEPSEPDCLWEASTYRFVPVEGTGDWFVEGIQFWGQFSPVPAGTETCPPPQP